MGWENFHSWRWKRLKKIYIYIYRLREKNGKGPRRLHIISLIHLLLIIVRIIKHLKCANFVTFMKCTDDEYFIEFIERHH